MLFVVARKSPCFISFTLSTPTQLVLVVSIQLEGKWQNKARSEEKAMKTVCINNMPRDPNKDSKVVQETKKVSLSATKIQVQKTGLNSGITGGGYQCC